MLTSAVISTLQITRVPLSLASGSQEEHVPMYFHQKEVVGKDHQVSDFVD